MVGTNTVKIRTNTVIIIPNPVPESVSKSINTKNSSETNQKQFRDSPETV